MTTYGRGRGRGPRGEHRHRAALGPSPRPRSGKTGAAERPPPPRRSSRSIELDAQWFVVASTDPYPGPVGLVALLPERADPQTGIRLLSELHDVQLCRPRGRWCRISGWCPANSPVVTATARHSGYNRSRMSEAPFQT